MSKYEPLWKYLQQNGKSEPKLSFDEVENILGFKIDHSFLTFKKELLGYGYEVQKISLKDRMVIFKKLN